jgi:hypothetical protein
MNRTTCISLEALRALGPETITRLSSALSIEAKAKASWESATAHVEQLFSEIALSCTAPVAEVPAINAAPLSLKPRPQDRSQEVVMPLAQPFDVAVKVSSVMAVTEAEATTEEVIPCTSVVVEVAPEAVSLPASGETLPQHPATEKKVQTMRERFEEEARQNGWLTSRQAADRLNVTVSALQKAMGEGTLTPAQRGGPGGRPTMFDPAEIDRYAVARVEAKKRAGEMIGKQNLKYVTASPASRPVVDLGPAFEREGVAHFDAIEQGKRKAGAEDWTSFYITFDPASGDVSYRRGKGLIEAQNLVAVERWEKSRGGIWDSQPMGKGLDGAMGAHMHTRAIGAKVLA